MSSKLSIFYLLIFFVFGSTHNKDFIYKYIDTYNSVAIEEMERSNIPASIKLAQGMLESNWGRSELALSAQNHFGIKCGSSWEGGEYYIYDDEYDSKGSKKKSCFRTFSSATNSYKAHTDFLTDPKKNHRYGFLFELNRKDYSSWAYGLLRAGYATDKKYAQKLIQIIEDYELFIFDDPLIIRGDMVIDLDGDKEDNITAISLRTEMITEQEVEQPTPLPFNKETTKKENKRKSSKRSSVRKQRYKDFHYVKEGETMEGIANAYRVNLNNLYTKNRLPLGSQPYAGEKIQITGFLRMGKRPKYFSEEEANKGEFIF